MDKHKHRELLSIFGKIYKFLRDMDKFNILLKGFFHNASVKYSCTRCNEPYDKLYPFCRYCNTNTVRESINVEINEGKIKNFNIQYGFEPEAIKYLEAIVKNHNDTLSLLSNLSPEYKTIWELGGIEDDANDAILTRTYFLLINRKRYLHSLIVIKNVVSNINSILEDEKMRFENLDKVTISQQRGEKDENTHKILGIFAHTVISSNKPEERELYFKNIFSSVFSGQKSLISDIDKLITYIQNLEKNEELMQEIRSLMERRLSFSISPKSLDRELSGLITVNVLYSAQEGVWNDSLQSIMSLYDASRNFGSTDAYFSAMVQFLKDSISLFISNSKNMLVQIYGKSMNFTIHIDIDCINSPAYSNARAFADTYSSKGYSEVHIGFHPMKMLDLVRYDNKPEFIEIFVHELGHIFDRQQRKNARLYSMFTEGVAMFTEFAHNRTIRFIVIPENVELTKKLMKNPINSEEDLIKTRESFGGTEYSNLEYFLGEHICFVIYLALLKRRFRFIHPDILKPDELNRLTENKTAVEYAQEVLKSLRSLDDNVFIHLYYKYAKELNIKPIIHENYLKRI